MQYKCDVCNDTGSRDKTGTYLDCNACSKESIRRDLNDFVKSLGPTHPEDVAIAIHQRALAMAPKQEAQPNLEPLLKWAKDAANGKTDKIPYIDITDLINENIKLRASLAYSGGNIAPAVANGVLTDEQIQQAANDAVKRGELSWLGFDKDDQGKYTIPMLSKSHFQFARAILAAAGPDAALIEVMEEALECFLLDHSDDHPTAKRWRATLSGAKGN